MSSPCSQRPQRRRQHASLSGRTDSSAESDEETKAQTKEEEEFLNFLCISFSCSINICLKFSGANLFLPCSSRVEYQPTTSINVAICTFADFILQGN